MVCVAVPTTLIVSPMLRNDVAMRKRNQKFINASFSLNPKYPMTKFLNLKLMFHATRTIRQIKTINRVLKRCILKSHMECPVVSTGAILMIGSTIKKKISAKRYKTNTFCCFVNLENLCTNLLIFSERGLFLMSEDIRRIKDIASSNDFFSICNQMS